jgi:hypothetical protein
MNTDNQLRALAAAVMLVFAGITGVAGTAVAQTSGNTAQSAGNVAVGVDQAGNYEVTVTVTDDGTAVEGATVDVTSDSAYAGTGSYQTDADGTVTLPAPAEPTTVTVTASGEGWTTEPKTKALDARSFANFGQRVSYFVHGLLDGTDTEGGIGQFVSEFVKKHNPSNDNKPEHAGKPEDAGKPDKANENGKQGAKDKDKGKPDHAGEKGDDAEKERTESDGEDEKGNNGNGGNGPDRDDNPGKGNGNGQNSVGVSLTN